MYKDAAGKLHMCSAICTHMGAQVCDAVYVVNDNNTAARKACVALLSLLGSRDGSFMFCALSDHCPVVCVQGVRCLRLIERAHLLNARWSGTTTRRRSIAPTTVPTSIAMVV